MIHHLAIASSDVARSHKFYTEAMGFELVKVVKRLALGGETAGWTKHIFYNTGGGSLFAIWDLRHLSELKGKDWSASWSSGLGLPTWINHVAFEVENEEELLRKRQTWLDFGLRVTQVNHDFIESIYTLDPDKNLVEFTVRHGELTDADKEEAQRLLLDDSPATIAEYPAELYEPEKV